MALPRFGRAAAVEGFERTRCRSGHSCTDTNDDSRVVEGIYTLRRQKKDKARLENRPIPEKIYAEMKVASLNIVPSTSSFLISFPSLEGTSMTAFVLFKN